MSLFMNCGGTWLRINFISSSPNHLISSIRVDRIRISLIWIAACLSIVWIVARTLGSCIIDDLFAWKGQFSFLILQRFQNVS